jgi:antitoxin component of MazEF toxin-antitoxin module
MSIDKITMAADKIIKYGSSIGVRLSRPILEKVFGLKVGDEIEVDYSRPPEIVIRPKKKA